MKSLRKTTRILSLFFLAITSSNSLMSQSLEIEDISSDLKVIVKKTGIPGLIARKFENGTVTKQGVAGVRDRDQNVKMNESDIVHFGSMFKVQTATLCGILVSRGILKWNDCLIDFVSPEMKTQFLKTDERWRYVTVKGLLSMSSGLDDNDFWSDKRLDKMYSFTKKQVAGREYILKELTTVKLREKQGSRYSYSNIGYCMAGLIVERAWKKDRKEFASYEQLMNQLLFKPLNITTATLGAPGMDLDKAEHIPAKNPTPVAIGHNMKNNFPVEGIKIGQPVGLGYEDADNPLCISPAGTWAMSLNDYLKLLNIQMQTEQTEILNSIGLNISELNYIRKPVIDVPERGFSFSLGWAVDNKNLNHLIYTGSNQRWVSKVDVELDKKTACVAVTNQGGEQNKEAGGSATATAIDSMK